jgi:hypothetical protein
MGIAMRKLILIAAISLLATQAQAGGSRSLSVAAVDASQRTAVEPVDQITATPQAIQPTAVATTVPTTTTQPPVTSTVTAPATQTTSAPAAPGAIAPVQTTATSSKQDAAKPKHRQPSVEARVIRELHRHGIYW